MSLLKILIQHMDDVERVINNLDANAAFAFALACTERQWPAFQRAVEMSLPILCSDRSSFRRGVDAAWEQVIRGTPFPIGLARVCDDQIPLAGGIVDPPSGAVALTVAQSIADLLCAVEKRTTTNLHLMSGRNLGLLEVLMDELNQEPDKVAMVRDLLE